MKTAIGIGGAASGKENNFEEAVAFAVEAERLGVDQAWTAEAWGYDAVSTLAYVGARTRSMTLGTGIMQISARTPSMTAMTALTTDPSGLIEAARPRLAFQLGAMGSAKTNFYNDAYKRSGFEDAATEVQKLWVEGRRDEAAARVPDEMILRTSMYGDEAFIRDRIRLYQKVGIGVLRLDAVGATAAERLETLGRAVAIVEEEAKLPS